MATPAEPVAGALFRALRTTADPDLSACRRSRSPSPPDSQPERHHRVEGGVHRPLIVLLAAPIFGLLYKALWG